MTEPTCIVCGDPVEPMAPQGRLAVLDEAGLAVVGKFEVWHLERCGLRSSDGSLPRQWEAEA